VCVCGYVMFSYNIIQLKKSYLVRCGQNALAFNGLGEKRAGKATGGKLHVATIGAACSCIVFSNF